MGMRIDHVVFCVRDLARAAALLDGGYGLSSIEGGRHPGHGTANRIVPLGSSYLELVAIVDEAEAAGSHFGRWVTERVDEHLTPDALCLRTDDLDLLSIRLGLDITPMSRRRPDGVRISWRLAGMDQMVTHGLPFFIQWDIPAEQHPGRAALEQAAATTTVELQLTGDAEQLASWVGGAEGVGIGEGPPGVGQLLIRSGNRMIEL